MLFICLHDTCTHVWPLHSRSPSVYVTLVHTCNRYILVPNPFTWRSYTRLTVMFSFLRWPVPGFSQLFLSYFSLIPCYFSNISHLPTISQLFLSYFSVISQKFPISKLFLVYFSVISYFSTISHLLLSDFSTISQLLLDYFPIISRLFPGYCSSCEDGFLTFRTTCLTWFAQQWSEQDDPWLLKAITSFYQLWWVCCGVLHASFIIITVCDYVYWVCACIVAVSNKLTHHGSSVITSIYKLVL